MKKVLVLGGTGAMGRYLVPELLTMGYAVDVVALDDAVSTNANLKYIKANAMDDEYLAEILKNEYDAIVDFLYYHHPSETFAKRVPLLLENTEHYINLSSYRVYAGEETPIKETSPRLLDVSKDSEYIAAKEHEYSLYKAIGEDLITSSEYKNWTIVRPAITYSSCKLQLITLENDALIGRMFNNKKVILPKPAMSVFGTMTWAGDVGKMIARLVLNKSAYGEAYTVSTSEYHTWQEIADYYVEIGGLNYEAVDMEDYVSVVGGSNSKGARWQLMYDRLLNRIIDNSKILDITGIKQSELMPLKEGLAMEFKAFPRDHRQDYADVNERMDRYIEKQNR